MRRLATIACLAAPLAAAPAAPAQERRPLAARLVSCTTGPTPASRTATFTARMPAMAGTERMWMRFDLLQRHPGQAEYEPLRLPAWGVWQRPLRSRGPHRGPLHEEGPGSLRAPGAYRARVRFRWHDASGRVQRRTERTTRDLSPARPPARPDRGRADRGPRPRRRYRDLPARRAQHRPRARCAVRRRPRDRRDAAAGAARRRPRPGRGPAPEHPRPALRAGVDGAVAHARRGRGPSRSQTRPTTPSTGRAPSPAPASAAHRCATHTAPGAAAQFSEASSGSAAL